MSSTVKQNAEQLFRNAFERIKRNNPEILQLDSPVTQNNVAREAGRDPSALKKDRYPLLVLEIQTHISLEREKTETNKQTRDNRSRTIKQKYVDCQRQRDKLCSIVAAQNNYIQELLDEIDLLKDGKVSKL